MKKNELIELGLSEELAGKVEEVINAATEGNVPKARLDAAVAERNSLRDTLKERDTQLEEIKKSSKTDEMKKQIEELQAENKKKDEKHTAELKAVKVEAALEAALTAAKAKNVKAVKALLDLDDADLDKDGAVKGLSDQLKKLKEAEDTSFLFDVEDDGKPAFTPKGAKPAESKTEKPDGKVDITKMSYEELAAYIEANPNVEIPKVNSLEQVKATAVPINPLDSVVNAVAQAIASTKQS